MQIPYSSKRHEPVYEVFRKNGKTYECLIRPSQEGPTCNSFEVTCRNIHQPDPITFQLKSGVDGYWIPNNTKLADPWMADLLGRIIINNF